MPTIHLERTVDAPVKRVFDLARSVDCHVATMAGHDETAVDGVTTGLLEAGDTVTWRARHLGVPLELTAAVTELDRPAHFRDEQVDGPFAAMAHDHRFESVDGGTRMTDRFRFRSPAGPLGALVDAAVLRWYLRRLLDRRAERLAAVAEVDEWRRYLDDLPPRHRSEESTSVSPGLADRAERKWKRNGSPGAVRELRREAGGFAPRARHGGPGTESI